MGGNYPASIPYSLENSTPAFPPSFSWATTSTQMTVEKTTISARLLQDTQDWKSMGTAMLSLLSLVF